MGEKRTDILQKGIRAFVVYLPDLTGKRDQGHSINLKAGFSNVHESNISMTRKMSFITFKCILKYGAFITAPSPQKVLKHQIYGLK